MVEGDGGDVTPRVMSPTGELDPNETKMVRDAINSRRTSYAASPSALEPEVANSHFHDMDLCILLHQMDDYNTHEIVKKALRKAVRQRVKKLGMKYDSESIREYRKSFHDHDPQVHINPAYQPTIPKASTNFPYQLTTVLTSNTGYARMGKGVDERDEVCPPAI